MSAYKFNTIRKRRSDDESSESDEEFPPPLKKTRKCNGESSMLPFSLKLYIKKFVTYPIQAVGSWISKLEVSNYFKLAMLRPNLVDPSTSVIDSEDDKESEGIDAVSDDDDDDEIAVINDGTGLGSPHNNYKQSSFLPDSLNHHPKPLKTSTPFYRGGSLVGLPSVPSKKNLNGFHVKDQKSNGRSQIQQKPIRVNRQSMAPITNPAMDIEILLDSNESPDSSDELEIIDERPLRQRPCRAFTRKERTPIPVFDSASNDRRVLNGRNSLLCTSPTFSTSISSSTAEELYWQTEKDHYQQLLHKMAEELIYRPLKNSETAAIQVDLTRDEHEEAVMKCCYNKDNLRKPVNDFMKENKPSQFVKNTIVSPPKIEDEIQEYIPPSAFKLPEYRPTERKVGFFSDEWLKELKTSVNDETEKLMEEVKHNERKMNRQKERREAKHKADKLTFEKYKVPGDVFLEPGGGRNDYPKLTPEMEGIVKKALQKFVGNENDELSTFNGVTVTRKHMLTLLESSWLIDEVLNFYFNLIVERSKLDNYPSVYAFNTFFYTSVNTRGINSVLRWTRKVDIFSYDIVFVPLHLGVHWALCVIDNRSKSIKYYDSMGTGHEQCLHIIQKYLIAEMKAKKNIVMDPDEYSLEVAKDLPQQMNGSDCGMFTLKYAEYVSRDAEINFKQADMSYFRRRMVYEILSKQLM